MDLQNIVRENIRRLTPYSSARKEYGGAANIFIDANENNYGSPTDKNYHRYPDPLQTKIKEKIAILNNLQPDEVFVGNGSDEAIDLLYRIFCEPRKDSILICPPTYGMYQVSAEINDIEIKRANLTKSFELDTEMIKKKIDGSTKIIFICSPNNPTGNSLDRESVLRIVQDFDRIVVVDEAYIHFSSEESFIRNINNFKNLVVLQTFSKAWGLAGLRLGFAFGNPEIIKLFNKVKPPYNVSEVTQETAINALENRKNVEKVIVEILIEREKLIENLSNISCVTKIFPTDANFVLVKTIDANKIYNCLINRKIVVRNRNNVEMCQGCLRFTVGTPEENKSLIKALKTFTKESLEFKQN